MKNNNVIKLWSLISSEAYEELLNKKVLICNDEKLVDQDLIDSYKWLIIEMNNRIINPDNIKYPLWAWYQAHNKNKKKPDMRYKEYYNSLDPNDIYRIEFIVDRSKVLLSDFNLWHYILNQMIICDTILEEDNIENIYPDFYKIHYNDKPKEIRKIISDTWIKIFNLEYSKNHYHNYQADQVIQGCVWNIHLDQVTKIDKFKNRFKN